MAYNYKMNRLEMNTLEEIYTLQTGCKQTVEIKPAYIPASVTITGIDPPATLEPNKALISLTVTWNVTLNNDQKTRGRIRVIKTADGTTSHNAVGGETTGTTGTYVTSLPLGIVDANTTVKVVYDVEAYDGTNWYVNKTNEYTNRTLVAYIQASGKITGIAPPTTVVKDCTVLTLKYADVVLNHDILVNVKIQMGVVTVVSKDLKADTISGEITYTVPSSNVQTGAVEFTYRMIAFRPDYSPWVIANLLYACTLVNYVAPVHTICGAITSPITLGEDATVLVVITGGNCDRNVKFEIYLDAALCATSEPFTVPGNSIDNSYGVTIPSAACLPVGTHSIEAKMVLV